MKLFSSVNDVADVNALVKEALALKQDPFAHQKLGKNKTLALVFLNPSLRTRMSTQKAAINLGMNVMVLNIDKEGWALELRDGVIMDGTTVEHIREAAGVMGQYADIIGVRSFPGLRNREEDYSEMIFNKFVEFCKVPVVSLESATRHPLQSLADLITIEELKKTARPKVILTWAPHIKPLPQAVPNSFSEWMCKADVDFTIVQPKGYELCTDFTRGANISYDQDEALASADFIYVKNWSAYEPYGNILGKHEEWMLTNKKLEQTNNAKVMHCLPVRRNLELSDEILDGPSSIVVHEAGNRVWAAQAVLKQMLESL
ncbi:N-acetylornithine carbamoyltransferase [Mucilaginibacter rubeus]|uniref:N-succinylornithine carbamoyltransferase n=1 Tax=Mucilaginibacter rubeus TaxID=2027860 RepID=A0AAE6JDC6_9SPHI|nr:MULTISPECIES: N-acetylornithine carbamoyltransferase [Mucilaginibacter]QEM03331.1 N-acetylornithine carbamoyltransferase [Mucilaginibacter rubeus]QEM15949.1 N-acetylornithine carbamoyltransferase [Mucilaginibacter gossypii]QTE41307.1 N-acetylornithine carbamoyltransferase [Mucilaginibacter rubeus]QTE47911.1 N-acetylornithine carbamoyltransferase [Mucilaginibacter rubeus]QTE59304.1 N-acetylornithine carbamoyltransferase [Mucilaginibacter rubeus]